MSHPFQFFPLSLVRPLLTEVLLCIDEAVVDDEVDVRVVRVEELNNVRQVRVVQEESEVLRRNTMITNKTINTSSSSSKCHLFPSLVITMTLIIARMLEGLHKCTGLQTISLSTQVCSFSTQVCSSFLCNSSIAQSTTLAMMEGNAVSSEQFVEKGGRHSGRLCMMTCTGAGFLACLRKRRLSWGHLMDCPQTFLR